MTLKPNKICADQIAEVMADTFKGHEAITCYIGSNAATPTTSIEALTHNIEAGSPRLPFIRMVHLLTQGPVPYVAEGLQDRVMTYSIFSSGEVRKAANEGHAFYLPCTLANLDGLIGKGQKYEPEMVILKVSQHPHTGEYSLGLTVEALHTAIDHASVVVAELDNSMPFTLGQSLVDAGSIDYIIETDVQPV
jgi:acyl-CoA hydrolase